MDKWMGTLDIQSRNAERKWVQCVKNVLPDCKESIPEGWYNPGQDSKESGFIIYMRTIDGATGKWHMLSEGEDVEAESANNDNNVPEFLVADRNVGRERRRGCCCSKGVTVRLPLDPGDDQNRRKSPCLPKE
eukprot:GHVU01172435.1.p1 GENE.GHVU01172435.1~~GHVU01172435.1.p1  ORF type:complete len:132 (-),score=14.59 GHVU01172435.1:892-1287(-)